MASSRQIAHRLREIRLELEMAEMNRQPSRSRAVSLQIAGLLLLAEGIAEGAAYSAEPIDAGARPPLALV